MNRKRKVSKAQAKARRGIEAVSDDALRGVAGGDKKRAKSEPSISEIVVTKRTDSSSPGLWTD